MAATPTPATATDPPAPDYEETLQEEADRLTTPAPDSPPFLRAAAKAVAHAAAQIDDARGFGRVYVRPHFAGGRVIVEATDGHRLARAIFAGDLDAPFSLCPKAAAAGALTPLDGLGFGEWPDTGAIVDGPIEGLAGGARGVRAVVDRKVLTAAIRTAADRTIAVAAAVAAAKAARVARDAVTAARKAAVAAARAGGVKGAIAMARRDFDDAHRKVQDAYDSATAAVTQARVQHVKITIDENDPAVDGGAVLVEAAWSNPNPWPRRPGDGDGDGDGDGGGWARALAEVEGNDTTFGMDARYLLAALRSVAPGRGGRVAIYQRSPLAPVAVASIDRDDGITCAEVIMPRRLD